VLEFFDQLVGHYGVPGRIVAGLAAVITVLVGLRLSVQALRRATYWPTEGAIQSWEIVSYINALVPLVVFAGMFVLMGFVFGGVALSPFYESTDWVLAYAFVAFFGGAVGAAELIARYKDRPYRAVQTAPAFFYISLNALAGCAALYLIYVFRRKLNFDDSDNPGQWPTEPSYLVQAVLLAGFSSLLFFRTSLFKLRVGEDDLAIGPSIVLDTLLGAADRAVDRVMAEPRAELIHELMGTVSFDKAVAILPGHCLALMQNVSTDETQRIVGVVNSLRANKEMPDKIKSLNLGLALLTVVGEDVLRTAVYRLEADLQDSTAWLSKEVAKVMKPVVFERARKVLPSYCFGLWSKPIDPADQATLASEMTALSAMQDVHAEYKSLILGIRVVRLTDGTILRKAVEDLSSIITAVDDDSAAMTAPPKLVGLRQLLGSVRLRETRKTESPISAEGAAEQGEAPSADVAEPATDAVPRLGGSADLPGGHTPGPPANGPTAAADRTPNRRPTRPPRQPRKKVRASDRSSALIPKSAPNTTPSPATEKSPGQ